MSKKKLRRLLLAGSMSSAVALLLCGCGKKADTQQADGQDVAHVGSDDITTSELQLETRGSGATQAPTDKDKAIALQRIAARKSLAEKAIAQGLDRQPTIMLEIRRAKDQILANAIASANVRQGEQKITLPNINAFIAAHPFEFGNRTLFQVSELLVPANNGIAKILDAVKTSTTIDQVETILTSKKIQFQKQVAELDSIKLPEALSQALLKPNNIPLVQTPAVGIFMQAKQTRAAPITGAEAEKVAKAQMVQTLYNDQFKAPSPGDDVSYAPPYKDIIAKMSADQAKPSRPQ